MISENEYNILLPYSELFNRFLNITYTINLSGDINEQIVPIYKHHTGIKTVCTGCLGDVKNMVVFLFNCIKEYESSLSNINNNITTAKNENVPKKRKQKK